MHVSVWMVHVFYGTHISVCMVHVFYGTHVSVWMVHVSYGMHVSVWMVHVRAANCYDFGVAATLFNPDYAATLVTSMLRL